ncbi:hypothetical protein KKE26_04830 [bacterium]|nr:hypothetical protein [bacterium]
MRILMLISLIMSISMSPSIVAAQDVSNREIINEITDLKVQVGKLETKMEEALKSVDSRMNDLNKRIDDRMGDMNNRMGDLMGLMHVIIAGMIALVGFILWDRRTAIAPVIRQAKELERDKAVAWDILREYAKKEPRFAEVLKIAGVL